MPAPTSYLSGDPMIVSKERGWSPSAGRGCGEMMERVVKEVRWDPEALDLIYQL